MRRSVFFLVLSFILVLVLSRISLADTENSRKVPQPIQEVFQSDLLYPQEKNEIQFSLLPVFKSQNGENRYQTEFELEYGFTDAWQLQLEWDGLIHRELFRSPDQTEAGDFSIGTQYSFMGLQDGYSHAALGLNLGVPVGDVDRGMSDGFFGVETYFTLARDFPEFNGAQLFSQMGVEWVSRVRTPNNLAPLPNAAHTFFWNAGGFLPVGDFRGTLEINWKNNEWNQSGNNNVLFLTPGVIWKISKEWELGVAAPVGLTDDADDVRVIGLLVYEIELDDLD
ncbi:MAG: hypothetical protein G3M70_04650 [Candidatus Nitronauta litoralis]|uniref:Uncharacterized protein n=1 Tax=Candidatus Nitronauta litoralis TaxID=2705533 RepID=A0A7T0FZH8_9BACT|nr:MAG: hypothetical protein G3M70_04650 [Candidatus Nitronauta litoralis]